VGPRDFSEKDRYDTLVRINGNIPSKQARNVQEFFQQLHLLEGSWVPPVNDKCALFEKLFACKMPIEKYNKYFKQEHQTTNKKGEFRFRLSQLTDVK